MCVHVCVCVCDSVTVVALDTHHPGHHHHLFLEVAQSFIQRDVGITHIHHQSIIHDDP